MNTPYLEKWCLKCGNNKVNTTGITDPRKVPELCSSCQIKQDIDLINKTLPEPPQMYPIIIREFPEDYEHEEVFG